MRVDNATYQGEVLGGFPQAKMLPKVFSPSLIAHHNTQGQLLQAWLAHVRNLEESSSTTAPSIFANFSSEDSLLKALFSQKAGAFLQEKEQIANFCALLQARCLNSQQGRGIDGIEGAIIAVKQQIAQLLFLADQDVAAAAALVDEENIASSLEKINEAFDGKVQKSLHAMGVQAALHDNAPLQNSTLAIARIKPLLIAELLVTSSGHLNLGLIDLIKRKFFNEKKPLMHHEKELRHTLDILAGSAVMQEKFHAIARPSSPYLPANDLVRVSLKLSNGTPLEDRHVKIAVLEALLSDLRQGDVGCCFGTCVAIMMMDALKERVLDDLISLVSQGKLIRQGQAVQKEFIPVLDIGDSALQSPLTLESSGKCVSSTGYVWEAPGISAACLQIGLEGEEARKAIIAAIGQIYAADKRHLNGLIETTPEMLLKQVMRSQVEDIEGPQQRDLKNRAYLAFNNEIHCPLLRAWESCLSAMAEAKTGDLVRKKIARCIASVTAPHWPQPVLSLVKNEDVEKVKRVFTNVLNSSMQLRYDPLAIMQSTPAGDGHSKILGAFVLHELKKGTSSLMAKPIETPAQFKKFVISQLEKTKHVLGKANEKNLQKQLKALEGVLSYVSMEDAYASSFVKTAIRYYDVNNGNVSDPLKDWDKLEHLPFRDATGNDVLEVYAQAIGISPGQPQRVRPQDAEELLKAFIAFGRKRAREDRFLEDDNPYQRYLARTLEHAFTLTPEDPSVVGAMDPSLKAEQWIEEHLTKPGNAVARLPLTKELKAKFRQSVCDKMLDVELRDVFSEAANKIPAKYDTICSYGNELLKLLLRMNQQPDSRVESMLSKKLTDVLLNEVLPAEAKDALAAAAVRIADTNWVDKGAQHLSFACFYNPLAQAIQLALLEETGTRLSPLRQDEWVTYMPWEMFGVKV